MNTTAVVKKAREEALSSATIGREDLDQVRSADTFHVMKSTGRVQAKPSHLTIIFFNWVGSTTN